MSARRVGVVFLLVFALGCLGLTRPVGIATAATAPKCADPSGKVKIGASYFGSVSTALENIGAGESAALTPADQAIVDGYKAGIQALNDEGGLAGCEVEGVFFNFKAVGVDFNQQSQQECAAMTQDNKVVAMYSTAFETRVAVDCFAKAKTPMFQIGNNYAPTCADYQKYAGYLYNPSGIATCRFGTFIDIWNKAGLFGKDAKVGILVQTDGSGANENLANKVWGPKLKKLKIPYETFEYTGATSAAGFGEVNAAVANAVLRFKSDGVNVVLFTPGGGQGIVAFTLQASNQGFLPKYGIDSADSFGNAQRIAPNASMEGAIGVSYAILDLDLTGQQALPANPAITECAAWSPPSTVSLTGASAFCDYLNILRAALGDAKDTKPATLQKGIEALGTSFVSSLTYGGKTKFGTNRYTGGYVARVLEYDAASDSFVFMSGQKPKVIP